MMNYISDSTVDKLTIEIYHKLNVISLYEILVTTYSSALRCILAEIVHENLARVAGGIHCDHHRDMTTKGGAMRLEGKVAIVTGAGLEKGFGQAIALEMAKEGANVVVSDISARYERLPDYRLGNREGLNERVAEIKALGRDALAVTCDVRSKDSVKAMVESAVDRFGKINILVNNAGFARLDPFVEIDEKIWDMHLDVMAKGSFLCSQAVIPQMLKTGEKGKIINIASIAGLAGWGYSTAYCAAKFAQVGLTKSLAHELAAQNINVNAICPGMQTGPHVGSQFATGAARCMGISPEEAVNAFVATMPQGKMGTQEDVAKAVVFLASPDSDYITGVALEVTGGQRW